MKLKHLFVASLALSGGVNAWAAFGVDSKFEINKEANALDGVVCVIADASNAKVFSTNMPGKSSWDVQGLDLANWGEKDTHKYIRFVKPNGYVQPAEENVYYIYFIDVNGVKHPSWGPKDSPLNQTGGTALFIGLDDNHLSKYGQDRDNGALWKVVKEGAGYTLQNVATNQYATPANNDVQNDKQYVKLYMGLSEDDGTVDLTAQINNPSFETNNMNGWTNNSVNGMWTMMDRADTADPKDGSYWVEKYKTSGKIDVNQTITNLPGGTYRVSVLALDQASLVKLVANTAETAIVGGEKNTYTVEAGIFDNNNLKFGLYCANHTANKWIGFDDFHLTYVSDALPTLPSAAEGKMNAAVAQTQTDAIAAYNANKTESNYNAALEAIEAAKASIINYTAVNSVITEQAAYAAKLDNDGKAAYDISAIQTAYDNGTITDGDIAIATLKNTLQTAVRVQGVGGDYTAALANPDFKTNDLTGWNTNGKATPAVDVANHDCEFYEKTFDMSQTVSNLKKGTYEISFQAFQRPGAANNDLATNFVNENWTSCATLYTSAQTADVKHICSDWQDAAQSDVTGWQADSQVTPTGGTLHFIPNSMPGGRQWFDKGYYVTTAKAVVLEDGGSLTFGFRGQQPGSSWILFDNFTMTYINEAVLIDEAESESLIATAEELESLKMAPTEKGALTDAKNALVADKTNGTKYNTLQTAVANAEDSKNAYAALKTALDNDAFVDRSAAYTTAFTYRTEAQTMYDAATTATDEVNAKANGMLNAYRDYVRGIAEANGALALAAKGARENSAWVYTTEATNNKTLDNAVNKDVAANSLWENYKGGGLTTTNGGDMKQTVNVPNGTYFLRMASFTRNSINADDYIYIKSGETTETSVSLGDASTTNAFINITNPIEVTNGQVEIGLHIGSGADWAAIGGVELHVMAVDDYARTTATEKYGTICLPYAFTATGANVYSASINGTTVELTTVAEPVAGTPYIYQATADAQTFAYASGNIVNAPVAAAPLVGVFTATPAPVGSYVLQTLNGAQKFYIVGEGQQPTVPANKAYLSAPANEASLRIALSGEETGINAVNALVNGTAKIYDLNGRQLKSLQKGVNIVNGAKVIVK